MSSFGYGVGGARRALSKSPIPTPRFRFFNQGVPTGARFHPSRCALPRFRFLNRGAAAADWALALIDISFFHFDNYHVRLLSSIHLILQDDPYPQINIITINIFCSS
jgi:hypothetical protein